ncbi:TadE/TadG family type IV pilus assembly protein [Anaerobium acetethylicum]|uniref:TadE-like protein n=1 Tax=Anaerobium acetethylicum TaxID=1619234 RepID=A0A1D3TV73_9FIRM|nr:TadE/TadG family type IV pilus assembly protein [Anaerobium acetethylicum]SCP98030.1 TadE-like protein [Anaerobium acetethylicum]
MKKWRNLKKNENAQALVEFTLVLPILILLVLGMIEYGWLLNGKITLNGAAREGARAGVVLETTEAARKVEVIKVMKAAADLSGLTILDTSDATGSDYLVVTANAKIKSIIGLYVPDEVAMTSIVKMKIE